jgi:hypothetical protein
VSRDLYPILNINIKSECIIYPTIKAKSTKLLQEKKIAAALGWTKMFSDTTTKA